MKSNGAPSWHRFNDLRGASGASMTSWLWATLLLSTALVLFSGLGYFCHSLSATTRGDAGDYASARRLRSRGRGRSVYLLRRRRSALTS